MSELDICEIFKSIQGESTWAGHLCSFVRLTGCNLRCVYCDTQYAFTESTRLSIQDIVNKVSLHKTSLVEITGGEPLLQEHTPALCNELVKQGFTVLVETNGSLDISVLPEKCIRIVDVKCPGSGMKDSFFEKNISYLKKTDEVKYVLSSKDDFNWAFQHVKENKINTYCTVLFSPVLSVLSARECAEWIIESNAPARLGLQLHRLIWGDMRGV